MISGGFLEIDGDPKQELLSPFLWPVLAPSAKNLRHESFNQGEKLQRLEETPGMTMVFLLSAPRLLRLDSPAGTS